MWDLNTILDIKEKRLFELIEMKKPVEITMNDEHTEMALCSS